MPSPQETEVHRSHPHRAPLWFVGRALARAFGSTVTISAVAIVGILWRRDRFRLDEVRLIAAEYWTVAVMVFCGVAIWNYWFAKTSQAAAGDGNRAADKRQK